MISSSLSIKIFGCSVGAFVIIGVPLIVKGEKDKKEAEEKKELIANLFPGKSISETFEGETFSDKAFQNNWTPNTEQQKYISANWQKIIPKMPGKFFEKYESTSEKSNIQTPNTCYLKILYSKEQFNLTPNTPAPQNAPIIYIPFPQEKITHTDSDLMSTVDGFDSSNNTSGQLLVPNSEKDEWNDAWKQDNFTKTFSHSSKGTSEDKKTYQEILFLEELYDVTSTRLVQLDFYRWGRNFWTYNPSDCSTDAAISKASK